MPGAGFTRKEYYININKEATFRTEPAVGNQTAISGEIQETPTFKPSNVPIRTKKHSELGAISNVFKGAFRGTLSYSETIQDLRPLARLLGNTIDMARIIKGLVISATGTLLTGDNVSGDDGSEGYIEQITIPIDNVTGVITDGDAAAWDSETATVVRSTPLTVTLSGMSGAIEDDDAITFTGGAGGTAAANLANGQTVDLIIKQFTKDEELTFIGSGADETDLLKIEGITATLIGTPDQTVVDTDIMTGQTSLARVGITTVTTQTELILTPFTITAAITITTGTMTFTAASQSSLIYQHQLSVVRDQNSYALNYGYLSLDDQHVMTGCVVKQLGLESAVNEAPKFAVDWLLSTRVTDPTRDDEVLNALDVYQYTDVNSLSIDGDTQDSTSTDWTDILKTVSAIFNRSNLVPIDSHTTQAPTGMKGPEVESTLNFGIHRQDATLWDLNLGASDDDFAIILEFLRGVSGEDDAIITYPNNRSYEIEEAGEETIFLTVPIDVKGTPTVVINDTTPDYST